MFCDNYFPVSSGNFNLHADGPIKGFPKLPKNEMRLPLYKNGISWYYNLYHGKGGFAMAVDKKGTKQIAANKKAWHD